jgi:hypothetical protein
MLEMASVLMRGVLWMYFRIRSWASVMLYLVGIIGRYVEILKLPIGGYGKKQRGVHLRVIMKLGVCEVEALLIK